MNLENTMLSEINQIQKDMYDCTYMRYQVVRFLEIESKNSNYPGRIGVLVERIQTLRWE